MAMIGRRQALLLLAACALTGRPALAADEAVSRFVENAYASALFQQRIAKAALAKDVRPEIRDLAQRSDALRTRQVAEIAQLARAAGVQPRDTLDLELRAIVENLEPLDYLAMSRRYAEAANEGLAKELPAYEAMARDGQGAAKDFAAREIPALQELAAAARKALEAVKP